MDKISILKAWFHVYQTQWETRRVGRQIQLFPYSRTNNVQRTIHHDSGYGMLADKLMIPRPYLVDSRIPANFELRKTVTIPGVGPVNFQIYKRREGPNGHGFLRFYMDCPICGKHIPVGKFHQHSSIHIDWTCSLCGEKMRLSQRKRHIRGINSCANKKPHALPQSCIKGYAFVV